MTVDRDLFRSQLKENLTCNILPYWIEKMEDPSGGFYGRRDGYDVLDKNAPKGAILNARILWSFSAAERALKSGEYRDAARRAYEYIRDHFIDREFGGAFWSLDHNGNPHDTKKQFYAIAFMIYGLAEYYKCFGDEEALVLALDLFETIEVHSRDRVKNGYIEACTRDWKPIGDMRLSEHDENSSKTMNTHLHILEGYTNLLSALKEKRSRGEGSKDLEEMIGKVEEATRNLLEIFLHIIENQQTHHLTLFFDDDWKKVDDAESYGHDIEASWLLLETAMVIGDKDLIDETLRHTKDIALAGLKGRCPDGSMIYELYSDGSRDADKHWWVQAENVIGQLYLSRYHSQSEEEEGKYLADAWQTWRFIADNLVDPEGEWHWSVKEDGSINRVDDKAGFWKCPYHNSRMCLEAMKVI